VLEHQRDPVGGNAHARVGHADRDLVARIDDRHGAIQACGHADWRASDEPSRGRAAAYRAR
jgi:hypothetical protein